MRKKTAYVCGQLGAALLHACAKVIAACFGEGEPGEPFKKSTTNPCWHCYGRGLGPQEEKNIEIDPVDSSPPTQFDNKVDIFCLKTPFLKKKEKEKLHGIIKRE